MHLEIGGNFWRKMVLHTLSPEYGIIWCLWGYLLWCSWFFQSLQGCIFVCSLVSHKGIHCSVLVPRWFLTLFTFADSTKYRILEVWCIGLVIPHAYIDSLLCPLQLKDIPDILRLFCNSNMYLLLWYYGPEFVITFHGDMTYPLFCLVDDALGSIHTSIII